MRPSCKLIHAAPAKTEKLSRFKRDLKAAQTTELLQVNIDDPKEGILGDVIERMTGQSAQNDINVESSANGGDCSNLFVDIPHSGFPVPQLLGSDKMASQENEKRIAHMTLMEICEAQQELQDRFGEELISKIRNKAKAKQSRPDVSVLENGSTVAEVSQERHSSHVADSFVAPLVTGSVDGCCKNNSTSMILKVGLTGTDLTGDKTSLSISSSDIDRLKWTEPIQAAEIAESDSAVKSIGRLRFDLDGDWQISQKEQCNSTSQSALFHHGEDPHAPGYTLSEMAEFWLPSSHAPQRIAGLRAISSIAENRGRFFINSEVDDRWKSVDCSIHGNVLDLSHFRYKAGFGFGFHAFERYLFEDKEIHWKTFLCCRSSNLTVQSFALQGLASMFWPGGIYGYSFLDVFAGLQLPTTTIVLGNDSTSASSQKISLTRWPTTSRSLIESDTLSNSVVSALLKDSPPVHNWDEAGHRLALWFSNQPDIPKPSFSVFDPVLHLILSGDDLRSHPTELSDRESCSAQTELGSILIRALDQFRGEDVVEIAVIRICCALVCHSKSVAVNIVLKCKELITKLEELMIRLIDGSMENRNFYVDKPLTKTRNSSEIKCWLLYLIRIITETGDHDRANSKAFLWGENLTVLVFVRQTLMTNFSLYDSDESVISAEGNAKERDSVSMLEKHSAASISQMDGKMLITETSRQHALSLLTLWAETGLWCEDLQSFFGTFMTWINDYLRNPTGRLLNFCEIKLTTFVKLSALLVSYVTKLKDFNTILPALGIARGISKIISSSSLEFVPIPTIALAVELLNLLHVVGLVMAAICREETSNNGPEAEHVECGAPATEDTTEDKTERHRELHHTMLVYEEVLAESAPGISALFKMVSENVVVGKIEEITNYMMESCIYSQYYSMPSTTFGLNMKGELSLEYSVLQYVYGMRLTHGACLLKSTVLSLHTKAKAVDICTLIPVIPTVLNREHIMPKICDAILSVNRHLKCIAFCSGSVVPCGCPDMSRVCPLLLPLHELLVSLYVFSRQISSESDAISPEDVANQGGKLQENALSPICLLKGRDTDKTTTDALRAIILSCVTWRQAVRALALWRQNDASAPAGFSELSELALQISSGVLQRHDKDMPYASSYLLSSNVLDCIVRSLCVLIQEAPSFRQFPTAEIKFFFSPKALWLTLPNNSPLPAGVSDAQVLEILLLCFSRAVWPSVFTSAVEQCLWPEVHPRAFEERIEKIDISSSSVLTARFTKGLDKLLAAYKEAPGVKCVAMLIWLFTMKSMPIDCRRLVWGDRVALQLLSRKNVLPSSLIRCRDADVCMFQIVRKESFNKYWFELNIG